MRKCENLQSLLKGAKEQQSELPTRTNSNECRNKIYRHKFKMTELTSFLYSATS